MPEAADSFNSSFIQLIKIWYLLKDSRFLLTWLRDRAITQHCRLTITETKSRIYSCVKNKVVTGLLQTWETLNPPSHLYKSKGLSYISASVKLEFMTVKLQKHWISRNYLERLPGESLWQHNLGLQSYIWLWAVTSQTPRTNCHRGGRLRTGLFCSHVTWTLCTHWVNQT